MSRIGDADVGGITDDGEDDFAPLRDRVARVLRLLAGDVTDTLRVTKAFARARIGDGLPIVAPTQPRVDGLLAGRFADASAIDASLPMSFAIPTWWDLAACAAMAGCDGAAQGAEDLLSVMATALEAAADPTFNLLGVQSTTGAAAPLLLIHGPIIDRLGLHTGSNALGPGLSPNAALGRAVQMVLVNVGLARPGEGDMATHGHPGKFTWCVAENQVESPWPTLAEAQGLAEEQSAVTVAAGVGNVEVVLPTESPEALVEVLVRAFRGVCSRGGVLLLPPDSAVYLQRNGWGRAEFADALEAGGAKRPLVMVTGGPGVKSTVIPLWGGPTDPVTRPIE